MIPKLVSGHTVFFWTATAELTDDDIQSTHSALIEEAFTAFSVDPTYLIDMVEHAHALDYKRLYAEVQADVLKRLDGLTDSEVDQEVRDVLSDRGIYAPEKFKVNRRSRKKR